MIRLHPMFLGGFAEFSGLLRGGTVPSYIQAAIRLDPPHGVDFVAIPSRQVPQGTDLEWWNFVMFASSADEWEVTTGALEIRTHQTMSVIHPDVRANEVGVRAPDGSFATTIPSSAWGKTCPHETWALAASGPMRAVSTRQRGRHAHGIIVVCNRAQGDVPSGARSGPLVPAQIVHTLFHEIALHAGTISYHLSGHPDQPIDHPGVDRLGRELNRVIPAPVVGLQVVVP